MGYTTIKTTFL